MQKKKVLWLIGIQCRYNFWYSCRGNGAKDKRKITTTGTSSDGRSSLGRTHSPDDEGPSLIGLYGGGIGDKVLKPPACMRQPVTSLSASKRGIIPLGNFCRANAALPPLPQSYDELYIHPKTAAGVVGERQIKRKQDVYNILCVSHA